MDFSEVVAGNKETQERLNGPVVSYSGKYIASVVPVEPLQSSEPTSTHHKLVIRSSRSLAIKQQLILPAKFSLKFIRWFRPAEPIFGRDGVAEDLHHNVHRIFAADDAGEIRVWDIDDAVNGVIDPIETLKNEVVIRQVNWGPNVPIRNVEWGRSPNEILVFSDFQVSLAIWSIAQKKSVEIYHPKYTTVRGVSFQPGTRHLTILTRPVSEDIISIYGGSLGPSGSAIETLARISLSDFHDVKGFKWSPDGRWIAVYDTITNYQVGIYTPLGALYRVFTTHDMGLGVHDIGWSPAGDLLAVASYDGIVRCLNTLTFTPTVILSHTARINTKERLVYVEQPVEDKNGHAKYRAVLTYPVLPPKVCTSPTDAPPKSGFGILKFNKDGTLLCTRFDLIPTTLWIWSLRTMEPLAILVHVRKIKSAEWHPQRPHLLLIVSAGSRARDDETYENYDLADVGEENDCCIHIWSSEWRNTYALKVPRVTGSFSGITNATWLRNDAELDSVGDSSTDDESKLAARARILICDRGSYTIGYLDDDQEPEDDDTKVQRLIDGVQQQEWAEVTATSNLDDTFAMIGRNALTAR